MSAEPPSSSGLPGRSRPQLSDLSRETTEDDLWNLDEDAPKVVPRQPNPPPSAPPAAAEAPGSPAPGPQAEGPKPRGLPTAPEPAEPPLKRSDRSSPIDEIGDLDEESADEEVVTLVAPPEPKAAPPAEPAAEIPPTPAPALAPADVEPAPEREPAPMLEPAGVKENKPKAADSGSGKPGLPRPRLNRQEVTGIACFALVLLIASLWVLTRFFSQLSFEDDSAFNPDFPLKGERATVESAESFWREPVRSGEVRDVARREVIMIPVLELQLDPEKSTAGALRVIFRNSQGEPVGDPITRTFASGRFEASGNATIAFPATDGFIEEGAFQAYRTGKGKPWVAELLEGPSPDAPANTFKKLSPIRILPLRR